MSRPRSVSVRIHGRAAPPAGCGQRLFNERTTFRAHALEPTDAIADWLEVLLSENGYNVLSAGNGREALDILHRETPDLERWAGRENLAEMRRLWVHRAAVRLARAAAEGEYVYVAGQVGPVGDAAGDPLSAGGESYRIA